VPDAHWRAWRHALLAARGAARQRRRDGARLLSACVRGWRRWCVTGWNPNPSH
jgi:hypothetical protein